MPPFSLNLFFVLISYITGLTAARFFNLNIYSLFILSALSLLVSSLFIRRRVSVLLISSAFILLGALSIEIEELKRDSLSGLKYLEEVRVEGVVKSIPLKRDERLRFTLSIESIDGREVSAAIPITVYYSYSSLIEPGDLLSLSGAFRSIRGNSYLLTDEVVKLKEYFSFKRYIYKIKKYTLTAIDELYPKEYAPFVKATVAGEVGSSIKGLREIFQEIGVVHILAISGLHVGLLLCFSAFLTRLLGIYGRLKILLLAVILISYMFLSGCRPPVTRATLMALIYLYFWFRGYRVNPFNLLMSAAFIMLLFQPQALFGLSFQLSFAAMSGIFTLLHAFNDQLRPGFKGKLLGYLKVTFGAYIFVLPLIWYYFSRISLIALFVNTAFITIFSYLISSAFFVLMLYPLIPSLSQVVAQSGFPIFYYLFKVLDNLAALPFASLDMPRISIIGVIFIYLIFVLSILAFRDIIKEKRELSKS
ncbi:MAG: ComEC/Rec2 family competence protein [Candidatus Kaelpia imicola]|nr:ComEC/Rec2 family competence protein [Candidatus Kaelpia imicola]